TQESIPYSTKYVNDNTLAKGTQVVKKMELMEVKLKYILFLRIRRLVKL
ncbi:hypothetical protein SFB3_322G2, partial [Candidatus Arthromitus sp. SFB-3]